MRKMNMKNILSWRYAILFIGVFITLGILLVGFKKIWMPANDSTGQLQFSEKTTSGYDTKFAPTPPMGWNSWNWFGKKNINEKIVHEVIDAIHNEGLQKAGYNYVVVDGGWRDTKLGSKGELLPHPDKFPHGMKVLADYAHSKGLKFGVHTVPGTHDCIGDKVGGFGHEEIQLKQFIVWGIDFIKLDLCRFSGEWNEKLIKDTYTKWSSLIKKNDANIILSISAYKFRDWYPEVGQMGRTTEDISTIAGGMSGCTAVFDDSIPKEKNKWGLLSVMQIAEENNKWAKHAGPGYWNDPDMLVTGEQGLSIEEQKSHFALWCIMSAPLMLGNDPRHMTQEEKNIILNKDCIRMDQDTTEQGKRIKVNGKTEIWAKRLQNNKTAVLLLNRDKRETKKITLNYADIGITGKAGIKDVYSGKYLGQFAGSFTGSINPRSGLFVILDLKN
jgi:alpha-galactosidase